MSSAGFAVLVPVKSLARAKSRLTGADAVTRAALMRAFAIDALSAALEARSVAAVHVVTDEAGPWPDGVDVLPDEGSGDLNRALVHAAARARHQDPGLGVAALLGDLPCLRADDLETALTPGSSDRWFVADAAGIGTSLLVVGPGLDLDPHFGPGSAQRHQHSGAVPVLAAVPTLRRDVDTDADLAHARRLGVGPHTAEVLTKHGM